jgi:hypothetical protein
MPDTPSADSDKPRFLYDVLHGVFHDSCLDFQRTGTVTERVWAFHHPTPEATGRIVNEHPTGSFTEADWPSIGLLLTSFEADCAVWTYATDARSVTGEPLGQLIIAAGVWPEQGLWLVRAANRAPNSADIVEIDTNTLYLDLRWLDALLPGGHQPSH